MSFHSQLDVSDKSKRTEFVEESIERALKWAEEHSKESQVDKSNRALEDLCTGMEQVSAALRALNAGDKPASSESPIPNIHALLKKAVDEYSLEIKAKGRKDSATDSSGDAGSGDGLTNVMASLAKAILICIHVKELLDRNLNRYNDVYTFAVQN